MLNTARRNIQYPNPNRADRPDIPAHLGYLAAALDVDVLYAQGTHAARLAAAHQAGGGKFWWETDNLAMWYDDGAAWHFVGPQTLVGTYAAIPAANTVGPGTRYFSTDTLGEWLSDGAAWTLINQGEPLISIATFNAAPFSTIPYNGQKVAIQVDAANGVNWIFKYNAGSADAHKWEYMGGSPLTAAVDTSQTTNSAAYTALTTAGPSITLPRAGDYDVHIECLVSSNTTNSFYQFMSYDIGGTGAIDADSVSAGLLATADANTSVSCNRRKTGLAAVALVSKYRTTGGIATFSERYMSVNPIRIS